VMGAIIGVLLFSGLVIVTLRQRLHSQSTELDRQRRLLRRVADVSDGLVLHNRDLERAVWIMSREYSDPLRTIQRQLDLVQQNFGAHMEEHDQIALRQTQQAVQRVSGLSKALGDYLGSSSGTLLCHPVDSRVSPLF
jgi:hypothetical protein